MRRTSITSCCRDVNWMRGIIPASAANSRWYSSSVDEATAICRNFAKSGSVARPHPSAMFAAPQSSVLRSERSPRPLSDSSRPAARCSRRSPFARRAPGRNLPQPFVRCTLEYSLHNDVSLSVQTEVERMAASLDEIPFPVERLRSNVSLPNAKPKRFIPFIAARLDTVLDQCRSHALSNRAGLDVQSQQLDRSNTDDRWIDWTFPEVRKTNRRRPIPRELDSPVRIQDFG